MKSQPVPGRIDLCALVSMPVFLGVRISPSRDQIAYYCDRTGRMELYVKDLAHGPSRLVGEGEQARSVRVPPVWGRDGRCLYFSRDKDGDESFDIFGLDLVSGEVFDLAREEGQLYPVEASPDGQWLTVQAVAPGKQMNLYRVEARGGSLEPLTKYDRPASGGHWHPSGRWILFSTNETELQQGRDVYRFDVAQGTVEKIFSVAVGSDDCYGEFSEDGRLLPVCSNATGAFRPGVLDWETLGVTWLGGGPFDEKALLVTPDGRHLLTLLDREGATIPRLWDLMSGEVRDLDLPPGVVGIADIALGGTALLISHQDPAHRTRVLLYHLEDDRVEEALPAEYGEVDPANFVGAEHVSFPSDEGWTVGGILYRPRGVEAGASLPAIVDVHGGPASCSRMRFSLNAQCLADRGFVVLQPNFRGSVGYGKAFEEGNHLDVGGADARDVKAAADYLRGTGYVDPNRIGITGGSYGGYLTYWAMVSQPEVWAAGAAWIGITDWHRLFEASLPHFRQMALKYLGDPTERADFYKERSPLTHADRLRSVLLMVQGRNDPRCPIDQARVFRDRLLELGRLEGRDFEYVELSDEGHGSTAIPHKKRRLVLLADFFTRRLGEA